MQTVVGWPTDLTSTTPTAKVLVGGVERTAESVSITRELGGSLPAQVIGGSGITAADGSVSWAEGDNVQVQPVVPWIRRGAWPPSPGLPCEVSVGYGDALAKQLTGLTTDTNGSFGSTDLSTGFEDRIAKLNRVLSFDPLLDAMPALGEGGGVSRYVGLNSCYITDRVLRACGFYATPPMMSGAVVSAPMNGSTWPERGTVTHSLSMVAGAAFPLWVNAPWGLAVQGVDVRYAPSFPTGENGHLTKPMEMVISLPSDTSGGGRVGAYWGSDYYRINVTDSGVYAQKIAGGTTTTVAVAGRSGVRTAVLRITPNGANVDMELRTNTGSSVTGSTPVIAGSNTGPITEVRGFGAGSFAGVQAGFPVTAFAALAHVPSAVITVHATRRNVLVGMPAIISRTGLSLLKEQEAAECAAMWIDANGVFRWVDRDTLVSKPPVALLTSKDNVTEANWVDSAAHVRSQVSVQWREALTSRSAWHTVTVYTGSGDTLAPGEVRTELLHPSADEDWIMVDTTIQEAGDLDPGNDLNLGRGTWGGGVYTNSDDFAVWAYPYIDETITKIDGNTYKVVHAIAASTPSNQEISLVTVPPSRESVLWSKWRDQKLPIIRAKARIDWMDRTTVGTPTGPVDAEVLTHDAGWWVQDEERAQLLADYLAVQTSIPAPIIEGLEIIPDPRLELADVIAIDDRDRSGMYLTGLVSGITLDVAEANMTMTIKLRVITADSSTGVTYADFTASRPSGETYGQFGTTQGTTKTYGQFQAAPLAP